MWYHRDLSVQSLVQQAESELDADSKNLLRGAIRFLVPLVNAAKFSSPYPITGVGPVIRQAQPNTSMHKDTEAHRELLLA